MQTRGHLNCSKPPLVKKNKKNKAVCVGQPAALSLITLASQLSQSNNRLWALRCGVHWNIENSNWHIHHVSIMVGHFIGIHQKKGFMCEPKECFYGSFNTTGLQKQILADFIFVPLVTCCYDSHNLSWVPIHKHIAMKTACCIRPGLKQSASLWRALTTVLS